MILRSLRLVHPSSAEYVASNTFSSDHYSWHSYRAAVGTASRTQLLSCLLTKAVTCTSSSLLLSNADVYSRSLRLAEEEGLARETLDQDVSRNSLARQMKAHDTTRCACRGACRNDQELSVTDERAGTRQATDGSPFLSSSLDFGLDYSCCA